MTRKTKKRQTRKGLTNQIPEAPKKDKDDDDNDDEEDLPSLLKRKTIPIHVQSMPNGGSRRMSKMVVDKDDDANDDVFTKTLSKMKDSRGRSNIGVKKTSFSSYSQSPHPGSRKK